MPQGAAIGTRLLVPNNSVVFVFSTGSRSSARVRFTVSFPRPQATSTEGWSNDEVRSAPTGKGVASFVVPIGSLITAAPGSSGAIFVEVMIFAVVTALLALVALKPRRKRALASAAAEPGTSHGEFTVNDSSRGAIA